MFSILEIHSHAYKEGLNCFPLPPPLASSGKKAEKKKKAGGPGYFKESGLD